MQKIVDECHRVHVCGWQQCVQLFHILCELWIHTLATSCLQKTLQVKSTRREFTKYTAHENGSIMNQGPEEDCPELHWKRYRSITNEQIDWSDLEQCRCCRQEAWELDSTRHKRSWDDLWWPWPILKQLQSHGIMRPPATQQTTSNYESTLASSSHMSN